MKLYPNPCCIILFTVTLLGQTITRVFGDVRKMPIIIIKIPVISRNYRLSTPIISFSLPQTPSNLAEIWSET